MQDTGVTATEDERRDAVEAHPITIALVVAMAENRVIGYAGGLPWRMPSDLKTFRRLTLGRPVVMGRKTFQSIGRPLDGRTNIVVSRGPALGIAGIVTVSTLDAAIAHGRRAAADADVDEVMVIGGAEIYAASLPVARRIYLTRVHARPEGDTWFPDLGPAWLEVAREALPQTPKDQYAATLTVLEHAYRHP